MTYAEQLRDPRWQRKRLEVMEVAGFACESCEDDSKTLHVHHRKYRKGAKAWEYQNHELQCLCESCHEENHELRESILCAIGEIDSSYMLRLVGYAQGLAALSEPHNVCDASSYEEVEGIIAAWRLNTTPENFISSKDSQVDGFTLEAFKKTLE